MLYDTEFLIALAGQGGGGKAGQHRAEAFLLAHAAFHRYVSRVTWSEFAEGVARADDVDRHFRRFAILEINERVAWIASRVARHLKSAGSHIGDNDVWIAATAVTYGLPLVSNNARHLGRVPGLDLRAY